MKRSYILVSGLPGSGKSTIGKALAGYLSFPFIDKDDILESLFISKGIGNEDWRSELSRESDKLFQESALKYNQAILISHWRNPKFKTNSGTPTKWLISKNIEVVELYCECTIKTALRRFVKRKRHGGHLDSTKTLKSRENKLSNYEPQLPIGIGKLFKINTANEYSIDKVAKQISFNI